MIRLHDLTQNLFSGERTFYSYLDDRFFILPPNQSNNFYLVTPSYLFEYDYSVLPGPIDSISVNDRQSIMLIKGERPDDSKYYCLSWIGVDHGPDCVYLEDLMEDKYFIGQTGWIGDDLLAIVGFKDVYYSYNYWSGELNEIDGDEVSSLIRTTNYQPTEPLSDNITDWKLFGNIVYNWQQKKAYRLNTPKSFHYLSDDYYLMIDRWQRLNLLDLVGGQYFYLNQVDSTPDFYQFEQGYRIDTQAFMLSDDYSLN